MEGQRNNGWMARAKKRVDREKTGGSRGEVRAALHRERLRSQRLDNMTREKPCIDNMARHGQPLIHVAHTDTGVHHF